MAAPIYPLYDYTSADFPVTTAIPKMETIFQNIYADSARLCGSAIHLLNAANMSLLPKTVNNMLYIMTISNDVY